MKQASLERSKKRLKKQPKLLIPQVNLQDVIEPVILLKLEEVEEAQVVVVEERVEVQEQEQFAVEQ